MREMVRYGVTLSLICIAASASLATVNAITKSKIIAQAKAEEEAGIKEVMPGGFRFEQVTKDGSAGYYKAYNQNEEFIGIVFKVSAKGYSSVLETIVGLTKAGAISAIKVVNQNETPGLGTRITEPSFTGQFKDRSIRDLKDVQAITRATISSKAVIGSVTQKVNEMKELIKNEK